MLHSILVIVVVGARAKLDLFHLNSDLFLFRVVRPFLLFVKKLAVIDQLTNRRLRFRRDLNQVDAAISRFLDRIARIHYPQQFPVFGHDTHRRNPYTFVGAVQRFTLSWPKIPSTKSSSDICLLD